MKVSKTRNPAIEISKNIIPEEKAGLSTKATDIQQVKETIDKLPNIREGKVEDLKNQLEQGIYNVSGDKIAEKMVGELLLDIIA
ncbi:MAG: flagellar biosynthesis anti-sigma factor FlgM [Syntrophobacterales bacterium]|nr:flagellar biosynthesis anti-sigma factor FlgM [Syntrophobacterales bacterium]